MDSTEASTKNIKAKPKNPKPAGQKPTNQPRQQRQSQQSVPLTPQEDDRAFVTTDEREREKDERQKRRPKQQKDKSKDTEEELNENSHDQDQNRPNLSESSEVRSETRSEPRSEDNEKRKFFSMSYDEQDSRKRKSFDRSTEQRIKNRNREKEESKDDEKDGFDGNESDDSDHGGRYRKRFGKNGESADENPPEGEHKLKYGYTFWFNRRIQGARTQNYENYEKNIKKIASFDTAEQFWSYYNHLVRPNELPVTSDYHLFKRGIKPMWEDKANVSGGKWIVRLPKGMASRSWEDLIIAMMGEQFDVGEEICGCVISIRYQSDIISIWNRNATDTEVKNKIRDTLSTVLNLPSNALMEYKGHESSLKDYSSFRNTDVYRQST